MAFWAQGEEEHIEHETIESKTKDFLLQSTEGIINFMFNVFLFTLGPECHAERYK